MLGDSEMTLELVTVGAVGEKLHQSMLTENDTGLNEVIRGFRSDVFEHLKCGKVCAQKRADRQTTVRP